MRPPGSVPEPVKDDDELSEPASSVGEDDSESEEEEEQEEEEEEYEEYAAIKSMQQRGGRVKNCGGEGCGSPKCSSCWPQNMAEWKYLR